MSRYEDRTKEELLELAREREIQGRSQMSKDELIAALRGEVVEEAEEEVVEEVVEYDGPPEADLLRAEYYRVKYEETGDLADYDGWKQAEQAHLS